MQPLFHKLLNNCHQATLLVVKREETKLNLFDRFKLHYHLTYCSLCRNFARQSALINQMMNALKLNLEASPPFSLSDRVKAEMKEQLGQEGKNGQ